MSTDEPSNWELMRAINALDNKVDEKFTDVVHCLWGPNHDNGLVTASAVNAQRICRIERIVYGVVGAMGTALIVRIAGVL